MNDDQMVERIKQAYATGDMQAFSEMMADMVDESSVVEWPQSGERMRGAGNILGANENYGENTGTSPTVKLRRITKPGDAWVLESTVDYGDGTPVSVVSIIELGPNGKVARQTDYFANPFPAPEWRSKWVERMEEPVAVG
jgi:hypothetical protein